jgi:hypothetical protein
MWENQRVSDETIQINTRDLDKFLKALKGKLPVARVGILGDKNQRSGKITSNALIGLQHEFGNSKLPMRSFLRIPISDNLRRYLENSEAFSKEVLKKVIQESTLVEWLRKIGILAETIVADAFDSSGFGKWPPSDMTNKTNHQTLVETQQLRNSITSDVK